MTNWIPLSKVADYTSQKINSTEITVDKYITTDSMLQNKAGITLASNLPPKPTRLSRYDKGHILISNIRPYLKKIWYANGKGGCSADVLNLEIKEGYNSKFIYYSLLTDDFFTHMMRGAKGSKMPRGDKDQILTYTIPNFEPIYQNKVETFLSLIDSKIEINKKINIELESLLKTTYNYWFVQFDFPDENGKPYKSSGGEMVWNEELKKEIPKDWEDLKLNTILKFQKGTEPGSSEYLDSRLNENSIKFYRVGDIDSESTTYIDSSKRKYELAKEDDVIVTFDGSVGKLGFGIEGAYSGGLRKIYDPTGKISNSLIFFIFKDKNLINTIHKYATGSIILHASSSIEYLKIAYNEKLFLEFQKISQPIFELMVKNKKENKELKELRDFLLPLLMNGQVTIND